MRQHHAGCPRRGPWVMPRRLPEPCRHPGCPRLNCELHRPTPRTWADRTDPPKRIRGKRLQQLRAQLFDTSPLCVLCLQKGRTTLATVRDHVVALAHGGADTPENTQALCAACNEAKRLEEAQWKPG